MIPIAPIHLIFIPYYTWPCFHLSCFFHNWFDMFFSSTHICGHFCTPGWHIAFITFFFYIYLFRIFSHHHSYTLSAFILPLSHSPFFSYSHFLFSFSTSKSHLSSYVPYSCTLIYNFYHTFYTYYFTIFHGLIHHVATDWYFVFYSCSITFFIYQSCIFVHHIHMLFILDNCGLRKS